jgi:hypothetical protein
VSPARQQKLLELQQVDGRLAVLYADLASTQHAIITLEERQHRLTIEVRQLREAE